jgi:hypothetical protein
MTAPSPTIRHPFPAEESGATPGCSATSYNLFQEPWWLDAVAAGEWEEVSVKRGGQLAARLPFVRKKVAGRVWLLQPKLTPYLGPWLRPSSAKLPHKLAEEKELMEELIDVLPKFGLFHQCFAPEVVNWLPFYWRGFSQTTRYTYRLAGLDDPARIWTGLRENIRREIRKARKIVSVRDDLHVGCLARVWEKTFRRQGKGLPVSTDLLHRIDWACQKRDCGKLLVAEDGRGKIHSAAYIVWDTRCAYYLIAGSDPELRNSGACSLVMWEAIQFASRVSRQFDFEGSIIEPIERFFRSFGGEPIPYFSLLKLSRPMTFLAGLYHAGCALFARRPSI